MLNFQFWTDTPLFQSLEVYSMTFLAHTHSPSFHSSTLPFSSFACLFAQNNMFDILFLWSFKRSSDSADQLADWVDSSQWPEVSFEQQRFSLKLFFVFAWGSDWSKNDWNGKIFSRISRILSVEIYFYFSKDVFPWVLAWSFEVSYCSIRWPWRVSIIQTCLCGLQRS